MARSLRDATQTRFLCELVIESVESEREEDDPDSPYHVHEPGPDVPTFDGDDIQFVSIFPLIYTPEFSNLRRLRIGDEKDMDECLTSRYGISHHTYCNPPGRWWSACRAWRSCTCFARISTQCRCSLAER
jgi:hypothetical protein